MEDLSNKISLADIILLEQVHNYSVNDSPNNFR